MKKLFATTKTPEKKVPAPTVFKSEREMPAAPISLATMEWNETGTWRYLRPRYVERHPACQHGCPTANDIEAWIRLFEQGRIAEAWDAATMENPFPAIMGRVCFHPCMESCSRRELGGTINIKALERELGDAAGKKLPLPKPFFKPSGKKVAVVGSGPAGLACAYHLARLGHAVTVFERALKAGGLLRYGIPSFRLPPEVLDREIVRLAEMGIEVKTGTPIRDASMLQTLTQDYAAVFLAPGAHKSRPMGVPDEKTAGVMAGLDYLLNVACGREVRLGKRVAVVGGGNTAVDAARVARRQGADVTIVYRRTRAEMPALADEVRGAEEEGIRFEMLAAPTGVVHAQGKVAGLTCQRMKLGDPDESGRRAPVPVPGAAPISLPADAIIVAIGEEIDTSIIPSALHLAAGTIKTLPGGRTEWRNLFVGGDFIAGPRTVVDALAAGKRGAIAIDAWLRQKDPAQVLGAMSIGGTGPVLMARYVESRLEAHPAGPALSNGLRQDHVVRFDEINTAYFVPSEPAPTPELPPEERFGANAFAELLTPLAGDALKSELARCFHCGRCNECDNCYIYCPDVAIEKLERGFDYDFRYCKGCGVCAAECPRAAIEMIEEPTEF